MRDRLYVLSGHLNHPVLASCPERHSTSFRTEVSQVGDAAVKLVRRQEPG